MKAKILKPYLDIVREYDRQVPMGEKHVMPLYKQWLTRGQEPSLLEWVFVVNEVELTYGLREAIEAIQWIENADLHETLLARLAPRLLETCAVLRGKESCPRK